MPRFKAYNYDQNAMVVINFNLAPLSTQYMT